MREQTTTDYTDLKLVHLPTRSPLPIAALPSISLIHQLDSRMGLRKIHLIRAFENPPGTSSSLATCHAAGSWYTAHPRCSPQASLAGFVRARTAHKRVSLITDLFAVALAEMDHCNVSAPALSVAPQPCLNAVI
jgi:hypothetical protein